MKANPSVTIKLNCKNIFRVCITSREVNKKMFYFLNDILSVIKIVIVPTFMGNITVFLSKSSPVKIFCSYLSVGGKSIRSTLYLKGTA